MTAAVSAYPRNTQTHLRRCDGDVETAQPSGRPHRGAFPEARGALNVAGGAAGRVAGLVIPKQSVALRGFRSQVVITHIPEHADVALLREE